MRADKQSLPKPMMTIGSGPVLWHIMRYFAHFGHTESILCLATAPATFPFRIDGGYFVLSQGISDYLAEGEDLVMDGCVKAARDGKARAVAYDGFWAPMDTLKERTHFEDLYRRGRSPWAVWREQPTPGGQPIIPDDMPAVVPHT
jgi:glucose-1-phosphate cytidylyltransferase